MKNSKKVSLILSIIFSTIFIVFTILLKIINIEGVGPNNSNIGFAKLNSYIFSNLGTSKTWDRITDVILLITLLLSIIYLFIGFIQFIKQKKLLKVDSEILSLGLTIILIAVTYVVFELLKINFRPILIDETLEASYPSTHTLLICTILPSIALISRKYIKNKTLWVLSIILLLSSTILTIVGRLLSGMHWFTDIVGSVILSASLVSIFCYLFTIIKDKNNN